MLGLERSDFDGAYVHVRGTTHKGRFLVGDQLTKRHVRKVPVPPSTAELLRGVPARLDTQLLFATVRGRLFFERNFYRDVWQPAREVTGLDCTPHEFRHSYLSEMRAAGIDAADLAEVAGHSLQTLHDRYVHPLNRSDDAIRNVIG